MLRRLLRFVLTRTNNVWPDEFYLKALFKLSGGQYTLDLNQPRTFNEKLNWNKLHDHNPFYHTMVDKYEVKKYVIKIIGEEYVVPCYSVWDNPHDINLDSLPNQFVLKATHDSSGVLVCREKEKISRNEIESHFNHWRKSHYKAAKEWVYKDIKPRIIADKYLDDHSGRELTDYKFWCFNGIPKLMYITNKGMKVEENFYDMNFAPVYIDHGFPRKSPEFDKPHNFELMKQLCVKLLKDIRPSFVRVDFFDIDNHVYFGEFTFYDWGGYMPFADYKMDLELGSYFND